MPVQNNTTKPSPDLPKRFDWDELNHDCTAGERPCSIAGLRPWRQDKYKLGKAPLGEHVVYHNYGHGGAGITMSWGCSNEIVELVKADSPPAEDPKIAIIGAGVMGLTSAILLAEAGYSKISIYAAKQTPHTTSDIAGGQWSPSAVKVGSTATDADEFERIMRFSHERFTRLLGPDYGVSERENYVHRKGELGSSFGRVPAGLLEMTKLNKLPFDNSFDHHPRGGWLVKTLLVEPPIFLPKLMSDLAVNHQIVPVTRSFKDTDEVQALDEKIIINCTGFGAKKLFGDPKLHPLRGQLILLPQQSNIDYLFSAGNFYVFSRADALILGGTFYTCNNSDAIEKDAEDIWQGNTKIFSSGRISRHAEEALTGQSFESVPDTLGYEIDGVRYDDT